MSKTQEQINSLANQVGRSTIAVIDAVTQRGGFRGEELLTIGTLREQCVQVVQLCEAMSRDTKAGDQPLAISGGNGISV